MAERRSKQERSESPVAACEMPCETVKRLDRELNGNGQPGIRQVLAALADESHTFFTTNATERTTEKEFHNKRDAEIKEAVAKHNWRIMFAVALVGLILAALQIYIDNRNHRPDGTLLIPHHITSPKTSGQTYNAHMNAPSQIAAE